MKTPSEANKHSELVECAFDRYADALIHTVVDLFNPDLPAFYRAALRNDGTVTCASLRRDVAERIQHHDVDKVHIIDTLQRDDLSVNQRKRLEAAYAMHDIKSDHHAACWCVNPRKLQAASFIEHLLDHAAVNLGQGQPPFDIDFLMNDGPFTAKRQVINGGEMTDIEALLNLNNQAVLFNVLGARNIYHQWVLRVVDTLRVINGVSNG